MSIAMIDKTCSRCGQHKPADQFHTYTDCRGAQPRARLASACKACDAARLRQYHVDHRDVTIERAKQWRLKHRERYNRMFREYRKDPEFRAKQNARVTEWKQANPEAKRNHRQTRRARVKNTVATLTAQEWIGRLDEFNRHCAYCLKPLDPSGITQEHMRPIARGGHHTLDNVIPACLQCNQRKGTKTLLEFVSLSLDNPLRLQT